MPALLTVVDAFTDRPFAGNPAAVCQLGSWPDDGWLRSVATEMNLSETAFVVPRAEGEFDLRWFTPSGHEMDLCGHATLASAHVLGTPVVFHTRSGALSCTTAEDGWIALDLPAQASTAAPTDPRVIEAIGTRVRATWTGNFDLIELASANEVRELRPDLTLLAGITTHGLIVTAAGDRPGVDMVSRVFAPAIGIPEDPVTGSAHCQLAPLWAKRLGRDDLVAEQASRRGGLLRLCVDGDRVRVEGKAVTVWRGALDAEHPSS
jgi:predicted PhzF superfamily epimerase YddE/YHI9